MNYQLNIDIASADLQKIYQAGQAVTITKSVVSQPVSSGNLPVAWLAFQPLQSNVVTWQVNYLFYASTTVIQSGATIAMTSRTDNPVQTGKLYTFQNGIFTSADGGSATTYNLSNQMQGNFNFGLAQDAMVNNVKTLAPLNAIPVLYNQEATFTPIETVSIYLSSYQNNGVVISQVASNALTVQLTSQSPSATIGFNGTNNTFYLESQALTSSQDFALSLASQQRAPQVPQRLAH